jgi:GntR family transcriptional regulator/MocR family aminotransferase
VLDLPIELDRSIRNQGRQVHAALRAAIIDGLLAPGLTLPSSRSLGHQLGVRRNAIVAAYEHLASDGLVEARHGAGTFVAERLPPPSAPIKPRHIDVPAMQRVPFTLGYTHVDRGMLKKLATSARRRIGWAATDDLGYGDPRGSEYLRDQVARYLAANRGVRCDPACIMIVAGTQHAIRLCADALLSPDDRVWVEEPGYPVTHTTLRVAGLNLVPVRVDASGIDVEAGVSACATAKAVYVTPSHQFPTGVPMSMPRRIALIDWAIKSSAWIIEDDYDSEFRYAGPPLTALAGLGSDRVIYIGTFTKILFASLRLAYVVLPSGVVESTISARAALDRFPPRFMQDAVADLIADGTLTAHVRRVRSRYREARDAVVAELKSSAGESLIFAAPDQGLHLLLRLPRDHPKGMATRIRETACVECRLLSEMRLVQRGADGFILGFSGYEIGEIKSAARRLGLAARDHQRR